MSMMYIRILVGLHIKYYTDWHDVDEDSTGIPNYGGRWSIEVEAGIMRRSMGDSPTATWGTVASNAKI